MPSSPGDLRGNEDNPRSLPYFQCRAQAAMPFLICGLCLAFGLAPPVKPLKNSGLSDRTLYPRNLFYYTFTEFEPVHLLTLLAFLLLFLGYLFITPTGRARRRSTSRLRFPRSFIVGPAIGISAVITTCVRSYYIFHGLPVVVDEATNVYQSENFPMAN